VLAATASDHAALVEVADLEDNERSILGRVRRFEQRWRPPPVNVPARTYLSCGGWEHLQSTDSVVYLTGHRAIATWSCAPDGEVYAVSSK
jgi:hypothetical protein